MPSKRFAAQKNPQDLYRGGMKTKLKSASEKGELPDHPNSKGKSDTYSAHPITKEAKTTSVHLMTEPAASLSETGTGSMLMIGP